MENHSITREDAMFYLDMIAAPTRAHHQPKMHRIKPFYKILDNPESTEFQRFIKVYNSQKHILSQRERGIVDCLYGVYEKRKTLKETGEIYKLSPSRIRQIRYKSERNISNNLLEEFKRPR